MEFSGLNPTDVDNTMIYQAIMNQINNSGKDSAAIVSWILVTDEGNCVPAKLKNSLKKWVALNQSSGNAKNILDLANKIFYQISFLISENEKKEPYPC